MLDINKIVRARLAQQRIDAENSAREMKQRVYRKIPAVYEIDMEIRKSALSCSKKLITGEMTEQQMQEQLYKLTCKRNELLKQNGISPRALEPHYKCNECNDTGRVNGFVCSCFYRQVREENLRRSNLNTVDESYRFDNYNANNFSRVISNVYNMSPYENAQRAFKIAISFIDNFDKPGKNLLFVGATGLGKTFLSACIARELIDRDKSVAYISAIDFFKKAEKARFSNDEELSFFENCDLLIIDDLGAESKTDYTLSFFSDLFDMRLRNSKKMIINSNLQMKDFEKRYNERIASRLFGHFKCVIMFGKDIRIQNFLSTEDNK